MTKLATFIFCFSLGVGASCGYSFAVSWMEALFPFEQIPVVNAGSLEPADLTGPDAPEYLFDIAGPENNFSGWLIADNFRGMEEVWAVLLSKDWDETELGWNAVVLTSLPDSSADDDADFSSAEVTAKGSRLEFRSKVYRGVSYKLTGNFTKSGNYFKQDEVVFHGTVTKIRQGKPVVRLTSDFRYAEPHCFH